MVYHRFIIDTKQKIKRLSLSIETLNRGSTLIHPIRDTLQPISRPAGMIYYCYMHKPYTQIQPFNSRAHFIPIPARSACSLWQTLSGTFRRITLPVLRLRYLIFSTPVLYAIYPVLSSTNLVVKRTRAPAFQHRHIAPFFQHRVVAQAFAHA